MGTYIPSDGLATSSWHIRDTSGRGNDINVEEVWPTYTGRGIRVGVYDDGVQAGHPDLNNNYDSSLHFVFNGVAQNPTNVINTGSAGAQRNDRPHGTAVAGIIAAEADNHGTVGVAYDARITAVVASGTPESGQLDYAYQKMAWAKNFDVTNHSYGSYEPFGYAMPSDMPVHYGSAAQSTFGGAVRAGMEVAAEQGRDGLGTVFVASAGNNRIAWGEDTNQDGRIDHNPNASGVVDTWHRASDANLSGAHTNSRYSITVGALDFGENTDPTIWVASYSNPGANLLVAAPGDIPTTDLTGNEGFWFARSIPLGNAYDSGNYMSGFGGTSAAAPVVTGSWR